MLSLLFSLLRKTLARKLSDEEAVKKYLDSQQPAYIDLLYTRYSSKVFGKCLTLLNSTEQAEDATQDIFMKIILNLSKFSGKSKFSTWLYSITYNYCIDTIRKRKKQRNFIQNSPESSMHKKAVDEVSDSFLLEMQVKCLENVLDNLNVSDRAILLMKYQDGMSIRDISHLLEKSESAVKMQIKRAKEKSRANYQLLYSEE